MTRWFAVMFVLTLMADLAVAQTYPEWLPPVPPRSSTWDLTREEPASRPGEEFADLLRHVDLAPSQGQPRYDPGRLKLSQESLIETAKVRSKLEMPDLRELREVPWLARDWKAEESLVVPIPSRESLFLFGSFGSEGDAFDNQRVRLTGKTGLGVKWSPFRGGEMQLRGGPTVSYSDVYHPIRPQEKSQLSVELQARIDLFGPLQLQYSGEALPALVQSDRHSLRQDLKFALPFGTNREFEFGAKYHWQDVSPSPWIDRTQLYLGIKFQH